MLATGRVTNGKVEVEVPGMAEGAEVTAWITDQMPVRLSAEERAALLESLASGIVEDGRDAADALDDED